MTARESRAAAAAGAGGSAAANPIMQIRGGRGLGRGGGCALSGSGIWEKFTRAEGAGLPRAGGRTAPSWVKEAGRLGRGEEPSWGVRLLRRSHGHTFPGTRARAHTHAELHPTASNSPKYTRAPPSPSKLAKTVESTGRHAHTLTYAPRLSGTQKPGPSVLTQACNPGSWAHSQTQADPLPLTDTRPYSQTRCFLPS